MRITDASGVRGLGEVVPRALDALRGLWPRLDGATVEDDPGVVAMLGVGDEAARADPVLGAAVSSVRGALADLFARRAGQSLCAYLGGPAAPSPVEVYANVNRSMLPDDEGPRDRSPAAFAEAARAALDAGFRAVKCAPFDEARAPFAHEGLPEEVRPGLARVAAVRAEIGPDVPLYVDCHRRFSLDAALALERSCVRWAWCGSRSRSTCLPSQRRCARCERRLRSTFRAPNKATASSSSRR